MTFSLAETRYTDHNGDIAPDDRGSPGCGERALWCAVILQAIEDALGITPASMLAHGGSSASAAMSTARIERLAAERFLLSDKPRYREARETVCALADVSAGYLQRKVWELMDRVTAPGAPQKITRRRPPL